MKWFLCLIITIVVGCQQKEKLKGGVCLSFDDRSIDEWFELRELFLVNEVKVTFFLTHLDGISEAEIHKLEILENDGHEIGFHGMRHVLSEYYIKEHTYKKYFDYEINPGIRWMDSVGFRCTSFAYPYGANYWFTDYLLGDQFDVIRGVSSLKNSVTITDNDDVFYSLSGNRTVDAIGFDMISPVDTIMINSAIDRCKSNNEVLLLFGHGPSFDLSQDYSFDVEMLEHIIKCVTEKNLRFYLIRELGGG